MKISDYIKCISRTKGPVTMESHYLGMYEDIKLLCRLPAEFEFNPIFTTSGICKILTTNDKTYLLYDQYLGQIMYFLSRIFFCSESTEDTGTYVAKLLAQWYQEKGNLHRAAFFALLNKDRMLESAPTWYTAKHDNIEFRKVTAVIQEYFIILHEIIHFYLNGPFRKQKQSLLLMDSTSLNKFYVDIIGEAPCHKIDSHFLSRRKDRLDKDIHRVMFSECDVETKTHWDEELFCDETASLFTLFIMESKGVDHTTIGHAILLCLLNLRFLSTIKSSLIHSDEFKSISQLNTLRVNHFRGVSRVFMDCIGDHEYAEKTSELFPEVTERYDQILLDPMVIFVKDNARLVSDFYNRYPEFDNIPETDLCKIVDALP